MSRLKKILAITLMIEGMDGVLDEFKLSVKKLSKKDMKPYRQFVKEQEKKHKKMDDVSKELAEAREGVVHLREDIEDIGYALDAADTKEKGSLALERKELRASLRKKEANLEVLNKKLNGFKDELNKLVEEAQKMYFELLVVSTPSRDELMAYMQKNDWGFDEILVEINTLIREVKEKKPRG